MTSPFPPPGFGSTPAPVASSPMNIDIPSPLTAMLPQIASTTSGLALTPGSNPFLALGISPASASVSASAPAPPPPGPAGSGSVRSGTSGRTTETMGLEECLRALNEAGRMIDRSLELVQKENIQYEYNQLITSLYLLSTSTFGGIPLHLKAETSGADLTAWCETRAALEFSRKEGVKGGAKVVLDVLKSGGHGQGK